MTSEEAAKAAVPTTKEKKGTDKSFNAKECKENIFETISIYGWG